MRVVDRITAQGQRLFQWRSIVPLLLLPPLAFALVEMAHFELKWGERVEDIWLACCLLVSAVGLAMRCATVGFVPDGTSGRGTGSPSAVQLNTLGMYSVVRNPLYLANGILWLGVALSTTSAWFVVITLLVYWLYIERVICAEEQFLAGRFGEAYQSWVTRTPCFLPRWSQWQAAATRFCLRTVLRREYPALIALGVAFTLVEVVSDTLLEGEPFRQWLHTDQEWVFFFIATVTTGMVLRFLKKRHWLDTPARAAQSAALNLPRPTATTNAYGSYAAPLSAAGPDHPQRLERDSLPDLSQALSDIRSIRGQLARGVEFRGYGPVTLAATGLLALVAAGIQSLWLGNRGPDLDTYLLLWISTAVISFSVIVAETVGRARRIHQGLALEMVRAALEQFLPPLCAGLLVTVAIVGFARANAWMLPGLWQLIFSLGVFASCRFLPSQMFAVGVWYLAAGLTCIAIGAGGDSLSPWAMGIPFGVGQLLVAAVLRFGYRQTDEPLQL